MYRSSHESIFFIEEKIHLSISVRPRISKKDWRNSIWPEKEWQHV
jgi:hypothetical protein